jgi:competence ComEA-like helix-hairpin-helix protein
MSFFNFTRQEQITILFLAFALIVGGIVTIIKRHHPHFAPELTLEELMEPSDRDTIFEGERYQGTSPTENFWKEKVDINKATIEDFMRLPGIGPKTAQAIVAHRKEHGGFQTLEELIQVKGIGEKTLERLMPFIKIE